MNKLLTFLAVAVFVSGCASTNAPQRNADGELDYGDYKSETLTTKAWNAFNARDYMTAIQYTEKVAELYEDEAREMQAFLSTQPPSRVKQSAEEIHANWALNDVGTSYYIRAESLLKLNKKPEALAAYKMVTNQFNRAQCWDPKGWFWSPADAASTKITMLSEDF